MRLQVGPTKTETEPNRTEAKATYAKRKSSPLNSHLGCQSLGLISLLAVASGYRLRCWGTLFSISVDSCRWLPMKINLVEFKWNSARCAKTKTECFEEPKNFARAAKGNTLVPTQTHTLSSLSMNSICQQHLHLFLFLLRGAFSPQEVSDAIRLSPISRTLIVI